MNDVTVCVTSIAARGGADGYLDRAVRSVLAQLEPPDALVVAIDETHAGAGATRNRAVRMAQTEWVAFLDDDDELLPRHLQALFETQRAHDADVVWPWYEIGGFAYDPLPHEGREWDPAEPHSFPITALVRRQLALDVGLFPETHDSELCSGEDWHFWLALSAAGATFKHHHERTWRWWWHGRNTSGVGTRW